MKYQIKKVSPLQTSKVVAIIYAPFGLVYTVIGAVSLHNQPDYNFVGQIFLLGPIFLAAFGFIATLFTCWLYNFVAKWVGGIEVDVEQRPAITIKQMRKDLLAATRPKKENWDG